MQNRSIESGVQLFSRMNREHLQILNGIHPKLFPDGGPFGNQVIEVLFNEDVDYTDFFIEFIVRAVLPGRLSEEFKECQVILLHTDFQINLIKMIKVLEKKLVECKVRKSEKQSLVQEALKKLVILNCYTSEQLEITFHNLERIINNCENPGLVILDNCLSQYWTNKFNNFMLSFDEHCIKIVDQLYEKIKDLNVVLMYGRACTSDNLKRATQVGYSIHIVKNAQKNIVANVTNFEKNCSFTVPFDGNI